LDVPADRQLRHKGRARFDNSFIARPQLRHRRDQVRTLAQRFAE
jgi:hypothetical protein